MTAVEQIRTGVADRVARGVSALRRTSPGPLLVRAGAFVAWTAALLTAAPPVLSGGTVLVPVLLAALPALAPRSRWGTVAALAGAGAWVSSTTFYAEPVTLWRLVAVAAMLYLGHTLTALAAVLPYDAVIDSEVLVRWLGRAALVVAATVVLGLTALVAGTLLGGTGLVVASVLGLGVAVGIATLLTAVLRRG